MKITLKLLISLIILSSLCSCVNKSIPSKKIKKPPPLWADIELAQLDNLWINNLVLKNDETNRVAYNPDAIRFGKELFFNKKFSKNGTISCSSCHEPTKYFTDGLKQAVGLKQTTRNAPTIVGSSNHIWFFHDGRADSLWAQAMGPIENPLEHGINRNYFASILYNDVELRIQYETIFGKMPNITNPQRFPKNAGPIKKNRTLLNAWHQMEHEDKNIINEIFVNAAKSIAAYETTLQLAPSRFDNYVQAVMKNDKVKMKELFNKDEVAGLKLFISKGNCTLCHNGPLFTDMSFHNIATPPLNSEKYDWGRYKFVSKIKKNKFNCLSIYNDAENKSCDELKYVVIDQEETMGAFKTPSLRNVTKTAPYMHAGQYETLAEVIKHYSDTPTTKFGHSDLLDIKLSEVERKQLEVFLSTLDSDIVIKQKNR